MKLRLVTSTIWIGILLNILILFKLNPIYCQINEVSNLVLNNVNIIDGISNSIQYGRTIVVKDSIIIGIGDEEDFEVSENAIVLDLEGKYVIPGLIEGHAHIQNLPDKQLENALRWGITSIRSMADDASYIQELNSAIQNEILLGPEIYYSSVLGGELLFEEDIRVQLATPENFSLGEAPWMRMIDDSSDIQAIIIEAKKNGVHGIKLYNYLNPGQIKTIVKYSKINDLMVWSHPHLTYSDAKEIALSNVDLITHAMGLLLPKDWNNKTHNSFELDSQSFCTGRIDSILNIVKKNDILLEPTFAMFFSHLHNVILDDTLQMRVKETAVNIIKEARNRGIQLIAGTDVILPQKSNSYPALYDELKYFVELVGMTPFEEIHSATYLGAKATGIETTHGSIELDKIANLVVLNDNPIENINNIKSMNIVIKHGKIIK